LTKDTLPGGRARVEAFLPGKKYTMITLDVYNRQGEKVGTIDVDRRSSAARSTSSCCTTSC